jgi:hypothetical protein
MIEAHIEGDYLIVKVPLQEPERSATGKTLVVASTHGNQTMADVIVDGKPVTIGLNAYIKPDALAGKKKAAKRRAG